MKVILTERQEAFCAEYAKTRSPGRAYRAAYDHPDDLTAEDANKRGRAVMKSSNVMERIEDLIDAAAAQTVFTVGEALSRWLMIATADPNELISLKVGACRYCHGEGHGYHCREREYVEALDKAEAMQRAGKTADLPDIAGGFGYDQTAVPHAECPECHGEGTWRCVPRDTEDLSPAGKALFAGVKMTNNGPQILMADRMKALENACRIIGVFKDDAGLRGDLAKMVGVMALETTDPNEAAKRYVELVGGGKPH